MSNKKFNIKAKTLPIAIQAIELRNTFPNSKVKIIRNYKLLWEGTLKPTPLSQYYKIRISYKLKQRPNVWVIEPELKQFDGQKIPHRFSDGSLCLFRFKYSEWDSTKSIAKTIIPWTSLWLHYYELWLITGEWFGEGEHPKSKIG